MEHLNLSILAIPAFHLLTILPHAAAIRLVSGGNVAKYDNRNPRAAGFRQAAEKRLSPEQFQRWERLEACTANAFENQPYFFAAIVVGNLAGLHKVEGYGGLTAQAGAFLVIRALYALVYAGNNTQGKSSVRSLLWFASLGVLLNIYWQSAKLLA